MTLRRLLAACPLAVLVAFAAHAAGFGSSHLLGGEAGPGALRLTLAWVVLLAGAAVAWVALSLPSRASVRSIARSLERGLPGGGRFDVLAGVLAVGGAGAFALLESAEGHGPVQLQAWWPAATALAALAVAAIVRLALSWLAGLGLFLARLGELRPSDAPSARRLAPAPVPVRTSPAARLRRGRAPPFRA
jgi:hypothetical protein